MRRCRRRRPLDWTASSATDKIATGAGARGTPKGVSFGSAFRDGRAMLLGLTLFAALIVLYGAVAGWLSHRSITMPLVFTGVGLFLGPSGSGILSISPQAEGAEQLTALTLALVLFADAST